MRDSTVQPHPGGKSPTTPRPGSTHWMYLHVQDKVTCDPSVCGSIGCSGWAAEGRRIRAERGEKAGNVPPAAIPAPESPAQDEGEVWGTLAAVAEVLGLHPDTPYRWAKRGLVRSRLRRGRVEVQIDPRLLTLADRARGTTPASVERIQ